MLEDYHLNITSYYYCYGMNKFTSKNISKLMLPIMMATKSKSSAIFDSLNTLIVGLNPTGVLEAYVPSFCAYSVYCM